MVTQIDIGAKQNISFTTKFSLQEISRYYINVCSKGRQGNYTYSSLVITYVHLTLQFKTYMMRI